MRVCFRDLITNLKYKLAHHLAFLNSTHFPCNIIEYLFLRNVFENDIFISVITPYDLIRNQFLWEEYVKTRNGSDVNSPINVQSKSKKEAKRRRVKKGKRHRVVSGG